MFGFALTADEDLRNAVDPGEPDAVLLTGSLLDGAEEPLAYPDGLVEVWHDDQFARARTDPFGVWQTWVRKPTTGLVLADGTSVAPHLNLTVWGRGLNKQVQTRLYFPDEAEANGADPILFIVPEHRRRTLVAVAQEDGSLRFDIRLQGPQETVLFEF
ncbi:hypothetical protein [Microbacterium sp. CH12i]|uniref:hypothetical protein n=1 Tax=Microbacterium sp. CH12i TaxID=1479651 RepID=UPI000691B953|nr:hypothetical protein [Microbacterium sp. CH12i]